MSEGLNDVTIAGNLTEAPELRFTQGGGAVLNLRVAIGERFKDREGEWKDRTEYVNAVVWGKRAEGLAKILTKGSFVLVKGALRTTSYEKDGAKRYKTEVSAEKVILSGRGGAPASGGEGPRPTGDRRAAGPDDDGRGYGGGGGGGGGNFDNDIPFASPDIAHDLRRYGLA